MNRKHSQHERGIVAVIAMMFLVVFSSLAAAMAIVSQGNLQTAASYQRVNRALAAAETGMNFTIYRLNQIANNINIVQGEIDETLANTIWPQVRDQLITEFNSESHSLGNAQFNDDTLIMGDIPIGTAGNAPRFQVTLIRHTIVGENYDAQRYKVHPYNEIDDNKFTSNSQPVSSTNPIDGRWIRVKVTGKDQGYERTIQMDFRLDKKIRFALLSRSRIMIGRNVMIRGTIGSKYTYTEYQHGHPIHLRDNFRGLDPELDSWLDVLRDYMKLNDINGDNRVEVSDSRESAGLGNPESFDVNGDGFVDYYDMFVTKFDQNLDGQLSISEFTDTDGHVIDNQLWQLMNEVKYPAGTEFDWDNLRVKYPGKAWIDATSDMQTLNNEDGYAKIHGEVILKSSRQDWEDGAANGDFRKYFEDSISPDAGTDPLVFNADEDQLASFDAGSFNMSTYKAMASGDFANQAASATANDGSQPTAYIPPSFATREAVPYNSPHPYDYYERPVYENMVFTDVTIPKGTNALFVNCKFVGVTFIDTEVDNGDPNFNFAGMINENGTKKYTGINANVGGTIVTDTKPFGNNIRFHDCKFEGMVASTSPDSFTHVRNKVQFTGTTKFDLNSNNLNTTQKQMFKKSTLLMPQYSVEMGTFVNPGSTLENVQLDGTIVAGVFDIRGNATIDGSIITTFEPEPGTGPLSYGGTPAGFNTTFGYFESEAGDGESELPTLGRGKIIIRYDPDRGLPDGILGPIEVRADPDTWFEGK